MPFRDPERHLRDILESIDQINEFIRDMDFPAYQRDEKTRAAVERKMHILTEAVIRLEMEGPEAYPEIDWPHDGFNKWEAECDPLSLGSISLDARSVSG